MYVSIDAGKFATKAIAKNSQGKVTRFYCRTKVDPIEGGEVVGNSTYIIEYEGKNYIIGEEAATSDYDMTKAKLAHRLTTLLAVSHFVGDTPQDVTLLLGCPLSVHKNPQAREAYKQYMLGDGKVDIKVNGQRRRFNLVNAVVLPETIGIPYKDANTNINKLLFVVDIGGLNSGGAAYQCLKPNRESYFCINEGSSILLSKIKRELNSRLGMNYQDFEMEYVINDTEGIEPKLQAKVDNIITEMVKLQVVRILDEAKRYNWNIASHPIHFTGGGSLLLEKQIKAMLPNAIISETAVWDNAEGFYRMGEMMYG